MQFLRKIGRWMLRVFTFAYLLLGISLIWGCTAVMPVTVHPMTDLVLEGETPSKKFYGMEVTLDGIYQARLYPARKILPEIIKDADRQHERSKNTAELIQQLLATSGLVSTGALPFALKHQPKPKAT